MKQSTNGFRDTKNPYSSLTKSSIHNTKENTSHKKIIIEAEVVETFPNKRSFQKELWKKIYSKESGDVLQIMRMNNENIKSSKITIYDNIRDINTNSYNKNTINDSNLVNEKEAFEKKITFESQLAQNTDSDYVDVVNLNDNKFSNNEKLS
jgi:hypothetical protein